MAFFELQTAAGSIGAWCVDPAAGPRGLPGPGIHVYAADRGFRRDRRTDFDAEAAALAFFAAHLR